MPMAIIENENIPQNQIENLEWLLNNAEDLAIITTTGFMVGAKDAERLAMMFAYHYAFNDLFKHCCDFAIDFHKEYQSKIEGGSTDEE